MIADPAGIRVSAHFPRGLRAVPGGTRLIIAFADGRPSESFVLATAAEAPPPPGPTQEAAVFRLAEADLPRLRDVQAAIAAGRTQGPRVHGSLSVSADLCHPGAMPEGRLPASTHLRTESGGEWVPVVLNFDLRRIGDLPARIPLC